MISRVATQTPCFDALANMSSIPWYLIWLSPSGAEGGQDSYLGGFALGFKKKKYAWKPAAALHVPKIKAVFQARFEIVNYKTERYIAVDRHRSLWDCLHDTTHHAPRRSRLSAPLVTDTEDQALSKHGSEYI